MESVPEPLREKYFRKANDGYEVLRELRQRIVFASHNLAYDPPFTRIDLLSCRNVLIYFDVETKKQILGRVRKLLKPGGWLFLGSAETTLNIDESFRRVAGDRGHAYQKAA